MSPETDATRYVRSIERHWARLAQHPIVLSPRDWSMLCEWHARGIPLSLVREVMEERMLRYSSKRARGDAGLRSLRYIASAVEEAWRVIVDGRVTEAHAEIAEVPPTDAVALDSSAEGRTRDSTRRQWENCRERAPQDGALHPLLTELLQCLEDGTPDDEVDRALDSRLLSSVPAELRRTAERYVDDRLAGQSDRMDATTLGAVRQRVVVERLRRLLGLPRLYRRSAVRPNSPRST